MTAIELTTCWAPVPIRWRYVQPGDVIAGKGGLLLVARIGLESPTEWAVTIAEHGYYVVDPDEMVSVLVPIPERDAGALTVEQLGAVVIGRRTAGAA